MFISQSSPAFIDGKDDSMPLREGYTAFVYLTKVDGRRQLVKKLKPEFAADSRYVDLFRKEYELGSTLHHPNLVSYRQFSEDNGEVTLMLDYIDGLTLQECFEYNPEYFSKKDNLQKFVNQLLSCIAYLHEHQVLHLDIKPSNIMITHLNNDVKVIDLGFCYSDTYADTPGFTGSFAAPEQKLHGKIDVRTDLYAVGRVLEEIEKATGKKLPGAYHRLKERCLEVDKDKRPASALAALKMVSPVKIAARVLSSVLLMILCVALGLVSYTPTRKAIQYAFYSLSYHDQYGDNGVQYRVLSKKKGTCEAVNWVPTKKTLDAYNVILESTIEFDGHDYRLVAVRKNAFVKNPYLRSIYIPEGVEEIGDQAMYQCPELSSVHLPNSIKKIGKAVFTDCINLESVVLSPSLKEVSEGVFVNCAIERLVIPEGIEILGKDCFAKNKQLVSVKLPSTLTTIDRGVFYECSSLKEIIIPEGVTQMGDFVFLRAPKLTDVYNYAPVPQDCNELFDSPKVRVHVPAKSLDAYKEHPMWGQQTLIGDL